MCVGRSAEVLRTWDTLAPGPCMPQIQRSQLRSERAVNSYPGEEVTCCYLYSFCSDVEDLRDRKLLEEKLGSITLSLDQIARRR